MPIVTRQLEAKCYGLPPDRDSQLGRNSGRMGYRE
jgi:hypothetical protein